MSMRYVGGLVTTTVNPYAANVTTSPNYAQYNGVFTLAQQAQAATSGQWCTDPFFKNTTLLLRADGTANASQNNTFLDSSTNNFTITRNGNTTQGTFSPYGNLWSNYFGTANGNAFSMSGTITLSGDFTIEVWLNMPAASSSGYSILFSSTSATQIGLIATDGRIGYFDPSVGTNWTATNTFLFNQWNHVAWVRSSGTVTVYLNGASVLTVNSSSWSLTVNRIGGYSTAATTYNVYGYMSNARITNTAVYTTAFTPSTAPLTAISGTQLLTCQSNRFIDNSSNAYTLTKIGSPSVQRFSPFNPTAPYSAATLGGSGYFDGTGDYLSAAASSTYACTGDFTVSCWYYPTAFSDYQILLDQWFSSAATSWQIEILITTGDIRAYYSGNSYFTSSIPCQLNAWNYIALVRSGSTITLYVNGVSGGSASYSGTFGSNNTLWIGAQHATGPVYFPNGYISDVRLVNGTAITGIPTSPLTAVTNTKLLCNFTNAGIADITTQNDLETVGNAQVSTSVVKYGSGSLAFDGSGDYLTSNPATTDLYAFGTGAFTIEFWYYSNNTGVQQIVYDARPTSTNGAYMTIYKSSGNSFAVYVNNGNVITGTATISASTWYHVAVCRSGTSTKMFVNGTQDGSTYTDNVTYLNGSGRPWIGIDSYSPATPLNGYIDDLRITKGVARYISNFTPPPVALPVQ